MIAAGQARTAGPVEPVSGEPHDLAARGEPEVAWWLHAFVDLLECSGLESRLERGRDYVHGGQVTELEVEPGIVLAKVQGTRYEPYRVRIRTTMLSEHQWRRVERALAAEALTLAQLIAGRLPPEIEEIFLACKLRLFPVSWDELKPNCTCADLENPCKHIAAVYYLLAEHFEAAPLEILSWRGRPPDELFANLRTRRRPRRVKAGPRPGRDEPVPPSPPTAASFWRNGPELAKLCISPLAGPAPDALVRRLGPAPVDSNPCRDIAEPLSALYLRLAAAAERRALGG